MFDSTPLTVWEEDKDYKKHNFLLEKKKCMFSQVPVQSQWFNSAWWNYLQRI